MNKRQTGTAYEEQAAKWLEAHGYRILKRNYRCRQGEIDLIAEDGPCLVFIEVKYRRDSQTGHPAEAVDIRKQRRITRTALYYCCEQRIPETRECRFDVVSILQDKIEHIINAFEMQA